MNAVAVFRQDLQWAHELLEMVMADVTPEQTRWLPPGIANPLGATYAHAVVAEDAVINGLLGGGTPLFASTWAGRSGVSEPQMVQTAEWSRNVKVDLPALREYAQAVYAASNNYLDSLIDEDLERTLNLSADGFGQKPVSWALTALVVSHLNNMAGKISVLKGIQGAKGYPF